MRSVADGLRGIHVTIGGRTNSRYVTASKPMQNFTFLFHECARPPRNGAVRSRSEAAGPRRDIRSCVFQIATMPLRRSRSFTAVMLVAAVSATLPTLVGCGATASARPTRAASGTSTGGRIISREQIAQLNVLDAYAVVERLSGYRLADNSRGNVSVRQRRGQTSLTNPNADRPLLLVDGTQMSDFDMLRRIRTAELERIELVPPGEATQRFGTTSNGAGAIIVITRSRQ